MSALFRRQGLVVTAEAAKAHPTPFSNGPPFGEKCHSRPKYFSI
jgi:hypothetical protein